MSEPTSSAINMASSIVATGSRPQARPGVQRRQDGSVLITSLTAARFVLRRDDLRQAGFNAELVALIPQRNTSVLFMSGAEHRRQRSKVARFFAPLEVSRHYRPLMQEASDRIIAGLRKGAVASLDEMSLELTVSVAAEIVGLTKSLRPGLGTRLSKFFEMQIPERGAFAKAAYVLKCQLYMLSVYLLDVRPAMAAAKRCPQQNLLSHLIEERWSTLDTLTECITYATAGISTTREFLVVAAQTLLECDDLRQRFLEGDEDVRRAIVEEILRVRPPVPSLARRASKAFTIEDGKMTLTIEAGTLIIIDVEATNTVDDGIAACPHQNDDKPTPLGHLSFGDGAHRCPGATIAVLETVVFLNEFLRLPSLRLLKTPDVSWNVTTGGYVLRGGTITFG